MALDPVALGMQPHPEGGWYRETWRHPRMIDTDQGERHLTTCVSFLLEPGQVSAWHRVRSPELWLWQGGGAVAVTTGGRGDAPVAKAERLLHEGGQQLVEADEWQTARPATDEPTLVACVVAPGFDFADFTPVGRWRMIDDQRTNPWPDGPLDADPDTLRGGPGYAALHAAHRLLNDRLAGAALPADVQREVTARLDELSDLLAGHAAPTEHDRVDGLRPDLPGRGHPMLPAFVVDDASTGPGSTMRGRVTFTRFHLGGNGVVHGGVQPVLFDDILGRVANHDLPSVARTAYLKVDYRRVTLFDVELHWDVSLDRVEGRKRFTTGRLTDADGVVLAEAEALFLELLPGQQ